ALAFGDGAGGGAASGGREGRTASQIPTAPNATAAASTSVIAKRDDAAGAAAATGSTGIGDSSCAAAFADSASGRVAPQNATSSSIDGVGAAATGTSGMSCLSLDGVSIDAAGCAGGAIGFPVAGAAGYCVLA